METSILKPTVVILVLFNSDGLFVETNVMSGVFGGLINGRNNCKMWYCELCHKLTGFRVGFSST